MTARADAFAPPTATFPLHDVTDVFARRHDRPNPTVLIDRLPRQTVFQIARLDTLPQAAAATVAPSPKEWWSQTGSNRRPHACKARALPTELWPQGVSVSDRASRVVVGLGRLERPTSPLSGVRSNHLSYRPRAIEARRPAKPERCADRAIW